MTTTKINQATYGAPCPDENVKLLIHCEGTTTSFTDEIGHTLSSVNGATQVTSEKKFDSKSVDLTGSTGAGIQVTSDQSDLHFTGDWTIDMWAKWSGASTYRLFSCLATSWANGYILFWNTSFSGALQLYIQNGGSTAVHIYYGSFTPDTSLWYHIAAERYGNVFSLYVNGVRQATGTVAVSVSYSGVADPRIGIGPDDTDSFNGYIDEIRFSNVARYEAAASFTVESAAYCS